MQLIIEAKIFLLDKKKRQVYDETFFNFNYKSKEDFSAKDESKDLNELLKKWMDEAKTEAKRVYDEMLEEAKGASKAGANEFIYTSIGFIIASLFLMLIGC